MSLGGGCLEGIGLVKVVGPVVVQLWSAGGLVVVRWSGGTVVRWFGGPVVRWSGGPVVRWSGGPVVR